MEDDWDLHAVVRGCAAASSTPVEDSQPSTTSKQDSEFPDAWFQDLFEPTRKISTIDIIEESLCRPFIPIAPELPPTVSYSQQNLQIPQKFIKTELQQKQLPLPVPVSALKHSSSPSPRYKKRKNQVKKKVCRVPPEGLSSDVWSWRKYGQKPIKGSPFPRGYYKCSTLKGCMARKQVERDRSDPGMFIVTYTAEHNHPSPTHRSSFAGITRQKPISPENPAAASASPEKKCSRREDLANDDGDDFSISDMALDDDFFVGLEDFTSNDGGGSSTDREFLSEESEFAFTKMTCRPAADVEWLRKSGGE